jgi:hypothetical protein
VEGDRSDEIAVRGGWVGSPERARLSSIVAIAENESAASILA